MCSFLDGLSTIVWVKYEDTVFSFPGCIHQALSRVEAWISRQYGYDHELKVESFQVSRMQSWIERFPLFIFDFMLAQVTKDDKKMINSWAMFDWANSSYSLVISSAIFPAYFLSVTSSTIHIGKSSFTNSSYFSYIISVAYILVALGLPVLSGIADYSGKRLYFLRIFTWIGSLACLCLFFFTGMETLWIGTLGFMFASIGFTASLVFYNSFLPVISTKDNYDKTSARGFAYGYVGSVILLIVNLVVIQNKEWFGIRDTGFAVRLAFVMVGLWWILFAQIPFKKLPADMEGKFGTKILSKGYQELLKVWHKLNHQQDLKLFLISFFFYSAGHGDRICTPLFFDS